MATPEEIEFHLHMKHAIELYVRKYPTIFELPATSISYSSNRMYIRFKGKRTYRIEFHKSRVGSE